VHDMRETLFQEMNSRPKAITMRQVIAITVITVAAFLAGWMGSGLGVKWMQARLIDYMGLKDGGEISSIELPPPIVHPSESCKPASFPIAGETNKNSTSVSTTLTKGSKETQNLQVKAIAGREVKVPTTQRQERDSKLSGNTSGAIIQRERFSPLSSAGPDSKAVTLSVGAEDQRGSTMGVPLPETPPAPLDPSVGSAVLASLTPSPSLPLDEPQVKDIRLEVAPSSGRSSTSSHLRPHSNLPARSERREEPLDGGKDWLILQKKMKMLGVTRFTIDGSPGGRVSFVCVIPLAGRQAISERFEAEGESAFQAAEAVMRRISLWQVSKAPSTPSQNR
jgi:hypothetical protein